MYKMCVIIPHWSIVNGGQVIASQLVDTNFPYKPFLKKVSFDSRKCKNHETSTMFDGSLITGHCLAFRCQLGSIFNHIFERIVVCIWGDWSPRKLATTRQTSSMSPNSFIIIARKSYLIVRNVDMASFKENIRSGHFMWGCVRACNRNGNSKIAPTRKQFVLTAKCISKILFFSSSVFTFIYITTARKHG